MTPDPGPFDLDAIRELAEAATRDTACPSAVLGAPGPDAVWLSYCDTRGEWARVPDASAAFIAATSPPVVLALCEAVIEGRRALAEAAKALNDAYEQMIGMDRLCSEKAKLMKERPDLVTPSDFGSLGASLWGRGCDAGNASNAARSALSRIDTLIAQTEETEQ